MESKHPAGPGCEGRGLEPLLRRPQPLERPTRAPLGPETPARWGATAAVREGTRQDFPLL